MNPLLKIAVVGVVVAGWYKVLTPRAASAVPEKAYRDAKNGFALVQPEGWELLKQESCGGPPGCVVAELVKGTEIPRPSVRVFVAKDLPTPSEGGKAGLAEKLASSLGEGMKTFELDEKSIFELDELAALRIVGRGVQHLRVETSPAEYANERVALEELKKQHPNQSIFWVKREVKGIRDTPSKILMKEAQYEERDLALTLGDAAVRGRDKGYVLRWSYDSTRERENQDAVRAIVDSFRVLDRPSPLQASGSAAGLAMLGAMAGLSLLALKILAT